MQGWDTMSLGIFKKKAKEIASKKKSKKGFLGPLLLLEL